MLQLRPYQADMIGHARRHFKAQRKRVLLQLATGGGKTAMTSTMIHTATSRGKRAWFVVHRRELVNQVCRAFDNEGIEYGVIAADYPVNLRPLAQIVSVQTVIRRLERLVPPDLLVLDEAHHAASSMWEQLTTWAREAYHLGLSATPRRLDGRGLAGYFDEIVCGPSMGWLIQNEYLAPYRLLAPPGLNMEGVGVVAGDYNRKQTIARVTDQKIVGDAVEHYQKHTPGQRAVSFCVSVEHAQQVAAQFQAAGVASTYFEGGTDKGLRDQITRDFESGHIKVLANCELLGEGYDLPAIESAILLRPTMSLTLYLQQVGRCLRFVDGKIATISDHVGNSARHGKPDDERTWTLEVGGAAKNRDAVRASPRTCLKCFAASKPGAEVCSTCGNAFPSEAREIESEAGELVEVPLTPEQLEAQAKAQERKQEQGRARSFDELVALAKRRHGHNDEKAARWAGYILQGREKKAAAKSAT